MKPISSRSFALFTSLVTFLPAPRVLAQDSVGLNTHVPANDLLAMSLDSGVR